MNNIKVVVDFVSPLFVEGIKDRIKQALINILANSRYAMGNGGVLKISVKLNDRIIVTIEDTGVGIHEQDIDKIFEPFFTTKSNGSGLGLTISKKIIEDHGGSISVSSRPGEGTIFQLALDPCRDVKTGAQPQ